MAVIIPANAAPDTLPRVRGLILTRQYRGQWIVQKWPRKRGAPTNWNVYWTSQQFGIAGRMAANSEPMQYITAQFLTKGSDWLPRDVLTMAAYGKFYEVYLPDGTLCPVADHGPPAPQPEPPSFTMTWQPNQVNGILSATTDAGTFASKGSAFIPDVDMQLYRMAMCLTPVSGANYLPTCCALNGSNIITAVTQGVARTITGTTKKIYEWELVATLTAGTRYAIMLTRTDGATNYALPVPLGTNANFVIPCTDLARARLASILPSIGETVSLPGSTYCQSLLLDF